MSPGIKVLYSSCVHGYWDGSSFTPFEKHTFTCTVEVNEDVGIPHIK